MASQAHLYDSFEHAASMPSRAVTARSSAARSRLMAPTKFPAACSRSFWVRLVSATIAAQAASSRSVNRVTGAGRDLMHGTATGISTRLGGLVQAVRAHANKQNSVRAHARRVSINMEARIE
jgi:hypothetical protein